MTSLHHKSSRSNNITSFQRSEQLYLHTPVAGMATCWSWPCLGWTLPARSPRRSCPC